MAFCATCGRRPAPGANWGEVLNTAIHPDDVCQHILAMRYCECCSTWWHRDGMEPDWDIDGCAHEDCPACVEWLASDEGKAEMARQADEKDQTPYQAILEVPGAVAWDNVNIIGRRRFIQAMEERGFAHFGESPKPSQLRPELQGQPVFAGLAGPMWGGNGVVRYESSSVCEELSR